MKLTGAQVLFDAFQEVEATLRKGLDTPKTVIMDFHVEPEEGVYPMVSPGAAITDMVFCK